MSKRPHIDVPDHWLDELKKLRCWLAGFHAGRGDQPSELGHCDFRAPYSIPGEDVVRQIFIAVDRTTK
jgi:hypothetical protein